MVGTSEHSATVAIRICEVESAISDGVVRFEYDVGWFKSCAQDNAWALNTSTHWFCKRILSSFNSLFQWNDLLRSVPDVKSPRITERKSRQFPEIVAASMKTGSMVNFKVPILCRGESVHWQNNPLSYKYSLFIGEEILGEIPFKGLNTNLRR